MEIFTENQQLIRQIKKVQQLEINGYYLYSLIADRVNDKTNRRLLQSYADKELEHYETWKKYTGQDLSPKRIRVLLYYILIKVFGLTFGLMLMEKNERGDLETYRQLAQKFPPAEHVLQEEIEHVEMIKGVINDGNLQFMGSIVLGINDALVELTGALAGLTFALQNTRLIAITGLITGLAASLSMAASEYLSTKTEGGRDPLKSSIFTGIAYVFTVLILISPYLVFTDYYIALAFTLINGVVVVALFTFYISTTKGLSFYKRFMEMLAISLTVAVISFGIGYLVRLFIPVEI